MAVLSQSHSSHSHSNSNASLKPKLQNNDPRLIALGAQMAFLASTLLSLLSGSRGLYALSLLSLVVANIANLVAELKANGGGWWSQLQASAQLPQLGLSLLLWSNRLSPLWVLSLPLSLETLFAALSLAASLPSITATPQWRQLIKPRHEQLQAVKPLVLLLAAHLQVVALPWLLISTPQLLTLFVYSQYLLVWQPRSSPLLRQALGDWQRIASALLAHPACPSLLKQAHARLFSAPANAQAATQSGTASPLSTSASSLPPKTH